METSYWFVSYHTGTLGFGSAFIKIKSKVFNYSDALSELREKKNIDRWSTNILYFRKVTGVEYEVNKCM